MFIVHYRNIWGYWVTYPSPYPGLTNVPGFCVWMIPGTEEDAPDVAHIEDFLPVDVVL